MQFDYLYQMQPVGALEVEDIGNCCISAIGLLHTEYIMIIKTEGGRTKIIQQGPLYVDIEQILPSEVSYTYSEFDFNEGKIKRIIDTWLNSKTLAQQAVLITIEEAIERIKNLVDFL